MRRLRSILVISATAITASAWTADAVPGVVAAEAAARDLTAREQASQVLNRLAFWSPPGALDLFLKVGVNRWM